MDKKRGTKTAAKQKSPKGTEKKKEVVKKNTTQKSIVYFDIWTVSFSIQGLIEETLPDESVAVTAEEVVEVEQEDEEEKKALEEKQRTEQELVRIED